MSKVSLKQVGTVAMSCMVILSANAANTQRFILKALGETRITVSQGETQAVQYRLSNNSDQTRTLIMKPIQGISQQVGGDGGYCGKLTTLKSGQSCVLSLTINSGEIANVNNASPLLCESGANWFDDQVVTSESCIQPLPDEKLSVNVIPAGNASFSIKIKQPENDTIGVKNKTGKNYCYHSIAGCTLALFAGGGTNSISLTSTSTTKTARNIHAVLPWTDVTATTCPTLAPGATCQITFNSRTAVKHPLAEVQILGDNTGPAATINIEVLGVGDAYQEGLIYIVNPGENTGMLAFPTDSGSVVPAGHWSPANSLIGTSLNNGLENTTRISDAFPFPTSPASVCEFAPGYPNNVETTGWYLPSYDEMINFVFALTEAYGDPLPEDTFALIIDSGEYYWTSSEGNPMGIPPSTPTNNAYQTSFVLNAGIPDVQASVKDTDFGHVRCIRSFS